MYEGYSTFRLSFSPPSSPPHPPPAASPHRSPPFHPPLSLCPSPSHCLRPRHQNGASSFPSPQIDFPENTSSDIIILPSLPPSNAPSLGKFSQQILIPKQLILILPQLDRVPSIFRQQHRVPLLHTRGDQRSIRLPSTGAHGNDLAFIRLVEFGFREEDTAGRLSLGQDALHQDAVCQGDELTERL